MLPKSSFVTLKQNQEYPLLSQGLENNLLYLYDITQRTFCRTVPNDDDSLFAPSSLRKYEFQNLFRMTRGAFIERVAFPELLTLFIMEKNQENYESASGRTYGKHYPPPLLILKTTCGKCHS